MTKARKNTSEVQPLVISYLRFSSAEQTRGDSIRRQLEKRDAWAKAKGWKIDDSLRDEGISAYRGANAATGALSRILKLVDAGTVPSGSYLVIENLDRLSRNELLEAVELFLSIVRRGINIVTLSDGYEYNKANLNLQGLMYSVMQLSRSNEESKRKSELVGSAWRNKKTNARNGIALTAKLPAWLEIKDGKIVAIPSKAKIVAEIFALALKGRGRNWICKYLNEKYPNGIARTHWSNTYVLTILRNKSVIGEFQPHKLVYIDGKKHREPEGDPILNYFPSVIEPQTFYAVQKGLEQRIKAGGPATDTVINFWQGLLHDMEGFRMISKSQKNWRRYYISAGRDGRGSEDKYIAVPANQFDYCMLFRICDYVLKTTDENKDNGTRLNAIEARIIELHEKLVELQEAVAVKPLQTLIKVIERHENELAGLERERYALTTEQAKAETSGGIAIFDKTHEQLDKILRDKFTTEQRLELREAIRTRIKRIDAKFGKEGRDYLVSALVTWVDGSDLEVMFRMDYIDYRQANHQAFNPYRFRHVMNEDDTLALLESEEA